MLSIERYCPCCRQLLIESIKEGFFGFCNSCNKDFYKSETVTKVMEVK